MSQPLERCYPGQRLHDSYQLIELIGRGGMGEVWSARHLRLGAQKLAIKVIYHTEPSLLDRLRREATIMSGLNHPHIAQIFDLLTLPTGQPFMVMELLRGEPLSARLRRGRPTFEQSHEWIYQASDALDSAHAHGVIHRDIKPDNLFICEGDELKVLDFGISTVIGVETLSGEGALIGTPHYMSPEQVRGERLNARSDLFSLALVAVELLRGERPVRADRLHAVLDQIRSFTPPPAPEGYPQGRWEVLGRALSLRREDRPDTARAWISEWLERDLPIRSINDRLSAALEGLSGAGGEDTLCAEEGASQEGALPFVFENTLDPSDLRAPDIAQGFTPLTLTQDRQAPPAPPAPPPPLPKRRAPLSLTPPHPSRHW